MQFGKTSVQKERLLSGIALHCIFDDDNDGCSDNYDDSGGNFDDNDDKNIQLL